MTVRQKHGPAFRLRDVCEREGVSVRQLARVMNVDYRGLRRIAAGESTPRWPFAVRIADALGCPLDELAHRTVRPVPTPEANGSAKRGGRK